MTLLIYLHIVFNQKPVTCLSHLHDTWPRQGVLRVELFFESPPEGYNLQQSYAKEFQYNYLSNERNQSLSKQNESVKEKISSRNDYFLHYFKILPIVEILMESSSPNISSSVSSNENETTKMAEIIDENSFSNLHDDETLFDIVYDYLFNFDWLKQFLIEEHHILEYSLEYGFLRLSPETRQRLNIEVLLVTLGKEEKKKRTSIL
jgi:hypothetical protein